MAGIHSPHRVLRRLPSPTASGLSMGTLHAGKVKHTSTIKCEVLSPPPTHVYIHTDEQRE
eukprot:m.206300 g.206300  ORF g.206300 m.206300 type:complete len:60 (+) comp32948_c0_seq1:1285-1464(+)